MRNLFRVADKKDNFEFINTLVINYLKFGTIWAYLVLQEMRSSDRVKDEIPGFD
jgi:hypothetical protein